MQPKNNKLERMKSLYIFLISMVPLIEQRGAIPVGIIGYGLNPFWVFFVSFNR